jgi:ADP-ribose pyrophosphatase YjhB (NUDIX family)
LGSAVLIVDGDRVLLGRRAKQPNFGRWVLPGGKIKTFESIADAAQRESLEETGLKVRALGQLGTFEIIDPPSEHRVIVYSYAEPVGGELQPGSDISEVAFFSRAELLNLDLTPLVARVLTTAGWLPATHVRKPRSRRRRRLEKNG